MPESLITLVKRVVGLFRILHYMMCVSTDMKGA